LGRDPRAEVSFDGEEDLRQIVAYNHAKIVYYKNQYILYDNDAVQHTFLDGKPITRSPLRGGEVVTLGDGGPRLRIWPLPPRGGLPTPVREDGGTGGENTLPGGVPTLSGAGEPLPGSEGFHQAPTSMFLQSPLVRELPSGSSAAGSSAAG